MKKDKIYRYIKGEAGVRETLDVIDWIEQDEQNLQKFSSMKADYVFSELPYEEMDKRKLKKIMLITSPSITWSSILVKIAAVLFIPLAIFTFYQNIDQKNKIPLETKSIVVLPNQKDATTLYTVNKGVKGLVDLPDGSKVWLNSNSSLRCPDRFDPISRIVELKGEGYFIVKSNKEWPMLVRSSKGITVRVTGTEFNLTSYENDKELRFTLVSGVASLIRESFNQEIKVKVQEEIIIPDDITIKGSKRVADIISNTGWKDGLLIFEDTPMEEVIKKMERWYGINFLVKNNDILKYRFTATFSSESVSQVLELLKITSNIGYSIKAKNVTLFFR